MVPISTDSGKMLPTRLWKWRGHVRWKIMFLVKHLMNVHKKIKSNMTKGSSDTFYSCTQTFNDSLLGYIWLVKI